MKVEKRTAVILVAGPLGAGKTTAINHLLKQRPRGESWAVLVNEYGLVGLDAALIEPKEDPSDSGGVHIREVAGGCICCSAAVFFEAALVRLLRRRPDRLLIEPTGLSTATGILDILDEPGFRERVDVRAVACLLDPQKLEESLRREEVRNQVDAAHVLLASRPDLATAGELQAFDDWAGSIEPPKRFVGHVSMGRVDLGLLDPAVSPVAAQGARRLSIHRSHLESHRFDTVGETQPEVVCNASAPVARRIHRSPVAATMGWVCWDGLVFDAEQISRWFGGLHSGNGVRRIKAVLRTDAGWRGYNYADGIEDVRPAGARGDSRLELVIESEDPPDADLLEEQLRACFSPQPSVEQQGAEGPEMLA